MGETYGRGQVMWAVWQLFLRVRYDDPARGDPTVPSEFNARVKKLWDFGVPIPPDERPGTGTSIQYSPYHAFELAVAMTLMDMGINQSDAARFVTDKRSLLRRTFPKLAVETPTYLVFRLHEIREGGRLQAFPKGFSVYVGLNLRTEQELHEDLRVLRGHGLIVLEISGIATRVTEYLSKAPEIRRGRP